LCSKFEFENIKNQIKKDNINTFLILGANKTSSNPEHLFVLNFDDLEEHLISFNALEFKHKKTRAFFYNPLTGALK
jgi:hypothetical protein